MSPTLMRQSKPTGFVTGSMVLPMTAATLRSIAGDSACAVAESLAAIACGAFDDCPGMGTVSSAQSTAETATIVVPTSRKKRHPA